MWQSKKDNKCEKYDWWTQYFSPLQCCNGTHLGDTLSVGGIPAPVYFGALIDSTCLKWSIKKCGGRGACRIYDSAMYRYATHYKCGNRTWLLIWILVFFSTNLDTTAIMIPALYCLLPIFCLYFQDHLPGSDHLSQWILVFLHHCRHHPPSATVSETRARNRDAAHESFKGNWTSGLIKSHWGPAQRS